MNMKNLINEYQKYLVISEKRDYNKTVRKYIFNIKECFQYMNVNSIEDIKNLTYISFIYNIITNFIHNYLQINYPYYSIF